MVITQFWKLFVLYARIFYQLKIKGLENIPKEGRLIIVFNHIAPLIDSLTGGLAIQSRPDSAIFGGAALPVGGYLGKIFSGKGNRQGQGVEFLAAKKGQGISGIELIKALKVLNDERAVSLAAEGEISWDGKLQYPLSPGAAWMALRANAPVVAIISSGGYDVMPRWSRLPSLTGKVTIQIGKPFYVHDGPITRLTEELIKDASDRIYQEMASLIIE